LKDDNTLDYKKLETTIHTAIRALDSVVILIFTPQKKQKIVI